MFTTLILFVCCLSLVITSPVDLKPDEKNIDGKQYTIKSVGATYTQRVSNHGQCMVELDNEGKTTSAITEGEIVKIKNKWFKLEDCRLNRAYVVTCGSQLFLRMHNLVCSYVEQHYEKKLLKRRQTENDLINLIDRSYYSECCKSACTVSELLQYCPLKR